MGRGVLVDVKAYMDAQQLPFHAFDGHRITVAEMEAVARHQGVEFRFGDILIVRTGATEVLESPAAEDLAKAAAGKLTGLHGTEETAAWVWNRHFSAVAGDAMGFEAWPPLKADGTEGGTADLGELSFQYTPFPSFPTRAGGFALHRRLLCAPCFCICFC